MQESSSMMATMLETEQVARNANIVIFGVGLDK
jgi:hypothetical protein